MISVIHCFDKINAMPFILKPHRYTFNQRVKSSYRPFVIVVVGWYIIGALVEKLALASYSCSSTSQRAFHKSYFICIHFLIYQVLHYSTQHLKKRKVMLFILIFGTKKTRLGALWSKDVHRRGINGFQWYFNTRNMYLKTLSTFDQSFREEWSL